MDLIANMAAFMMKLKEACIKEGISTDFINADVTSIDMENHRITFSTSSLKSYPFVVSFNPETKWSLKDDSDLFMFVNDDLVVKRIISKIITNRWSDYIDGKESEE